MSVLSSAVVRTLPTHGERVVEAGHRLHGAHYAIVHAAARFADSDEWIIGYSTPAHWIAEQLGTCLATARDWIRIGRVLERVPALDEVFACGRLSYSKVRALSSVVAPDTADELIAIAERVPAGRLGIELAAWSRRHESDEKRARRHRRHRGLRHFTRPDGMVQITATLPPADAGFVLAAIDATLMKTAPRAVRDPAPESGGNATAVASDGSDAAFPSIAQQRADALVAAMRGSGASVQTELVINVRGDGCTLDDGTPVPDSVVAELAPTSFLRALIVDAERRPINASGRHRHPTTRQKRVVKARDRRCVDCGSTDLLEYDHNPDYEITGRTVVEELELRCAPCHRRRHRFDL